MSQRMGGLNKLLLPINGVPMVRHMALTLVAFADVSPVVVLGHEAERVAAALDGIALTMITNCTLSIWADEFGYSWSHRRRTGRQLYDLFG